MAYLCKQLNPKGREHPHETAQTFRNYMNIHITNNGKTESLVLESLITPVRQVIWVGKHSETVYNTIHVEGIETFQCSITFDKEANTWLLTHGQVRTECPRGLMSNRAKACSMCMGRCVNPRPANPTYSLRMPTEETLLNGEAVPAEGALLTEGDTISFGPTITGS